MQHHLRLDELLARDVRVHWFEGVAVVQSVCRHLAESGLPGFPPASAISLAADGTISILDTARGRPAASAAHVLAQMLGDEVPVRLRLIVTQAIEAQGPYATLSELSDALAYFERPHQDQILRELFERAMAATHRSEAAPGAAEPEDSQLEAAGTREAEPPARRLASRTAALGAGAAILVASLWLLAFGSGSARISAALDTWKQTFAGPAPAAADEPVEREAASAVPVRRRNAAAGRRETATITPTGTSLPGKLPRADRTARPSWQTAFLPGPALFPAATVVDNGSQARLVVIDPVTILEAARPGAPQDVFDGGRLYTSADSGVTLPRHVYPKLPVDTNPVAGAETRTVLELVVASNGLVEHVRLRTPPRDVHEFMLVSAAKAWRFEPATIEGRPVRFLHRMPIPNP